MVTIKNFHKKLGKTDVNKRLTALVKQIEKIKCTLIIYKKYNKKSV